MSSSVRIFLSCSIARLLQVLRCIVNLSDTASVETRLTTDAVSPEPLIIAALVSIIDLERTESLLSWWEKTVLVISHA